MTITVNITGETADDIRAQLVGLVGIVTNSDKAPPVQVAAQQQVQAPVDNKAGRARKPAAASAPAEPASPPPAAPAELAAPAEPATQPDPTPAAAAAEDSKPVSLEEVRAYLASKSQEHSKAIAELIASFGVKRLSEIPAEKLSEIMAQAKEKFQ